MSDSGLPHRGLALLGRAFRDRASGLLSLGRGSTALALVLREGHIVGVVFPEDAKPPASAHDDSAQRRLDRVLAEIGMRAPAPRTVPRTRRSLRERMISGLLDSGAPGTGFTDGAAPPAGVVDVAGATEALILEAIRRMPDPETVRDGLGDLDQRLVPSAAIAEERTLTLTEGYILSHVDGSATARDVLRRVPLEPRETERTLLGLLLTGRLEYRPTLAKPAAGRAEAAAPVPTPPAADAQHEPLLLQWDDGETGRPATPVGAEALAGTAGDGAAEGMVAASAAAPAAPAGWEASSAEVAGPEGPAALAASPPAEGAEATPAPFAGAGGPAAADAAEMERDAVVDGPRAAGAEGIPLASPSTAHEEPAGGEAQPEGEAAGPGETAEAPAAAVRVERLEPEPAREPEGEGEAAGTRDSPAPVLEPAVAEARREVLAFFESLASKSHFEVLGVEPGCTDADVKRAYAALARKYHPDLHHRNGLEDLHDVLEGIFIRVGEAWEVLGDARSRRSYEARLAPRSPAAEDAAAATAEAEAEPYVPGEETVHAAQLLLSQARYWDAIQMLEARLPQMPPSRQQRRGRILLARAYAKNPNWLRRAEEALQQVVREDPANADAHYELGLLYKAGGMQARAQASFRRTLDLQPDHRHAAAELGGKRGAAPASSPTAGGLLKRLFGGRGKAS